MKNKTLERIKKMTKKHYGTIILVTIIALLIDVLALIKPYFVKILIDDFLNKGVSRMGIVSTAVIAYSYIGLSLMENVLDYINRIKTNKIGEIVVYDLRNQVFKHIENANIGFHDKNPSGKLFVRIMSDIEDVFVLFSEVITTFVKDFFIIIGLLVVMIYISYKLALVNVIIVPLIIITSIILTKLFNVFYTKLKNARTRINTFFQNLFMELS